MNINNIQQRNIYIAFIIMGALASGFTIWNHLESQKLRKIQKKIAEINLQKLEQEETLKKA